MMAEPKPTAPDGPVVDTELAELARARARISDLEAALEAAQRKATRATDTDGTTRDALARSEQRFRKLIEHLHIGVVVQGPRSEILLYNARALELLGLSEDEIHGRTSFDPSWEVIREDGSPYLPEERPVAVVLTTRQAVRGVVMGIKRPRTHDQVWLRVHALPEHDEHGEVVQVVATLDDITERKRLDDSLVHTQKLDSLGLLAGGIAHDFNNLLTVITNCTELARQALPDDFEAAADVAADLGEVLMASDRATALTRQLLSFARGHTGGSPRRLDICATVSQFEKLLGRLLASTHALTIDYEPGPITVKIDQSQLEQVLVNLVVNARDAMPDGGQIHVSMGRVGPGHAPGELAGRAAALLCVRDHGVGMTPEVRARVFEPFFTTKQRGRGTGLGLATVHGIVRQAGGHIHIRSAPGQGTEFCLFLPLQAERDESLVSRRVTGLGRGERVLVVDDDDVLCSVAARMLSELGYHTQEAADGYEALDLLEQRDGAFDVLLTDIIMPRMGGLELAQRVHARWPAIHVIASSGQIALLELETELRSVDAVLPKPFTLASLGRVVRNVLDA